MALLARMLEFGIYVCQKYTLGEAEALVHIGERYLRRHPELDLTVLARQTNRERESDVEKADQMLEAIRRERVRRSYEGE